MFEEFGYMSNDPELYYGKKIKSAEFINDELRLNFEDNTTIAIGDHGQSCCESRYMTTDDNVDFLNNKELRKIEIKNAPDIENGYDIHEVQFLEILTNEGSVTFATHNEHNGYYGGFSICIREIN